MLQLHQFLHFFITLNFLKLVRIEKATHPSIRMCGEFMVFFTITKTKLCRNKEKPPRNRRLFSRRTAIAG